jgi:hypothetical protein
MANVNEKMFNEGNQIHNFMSSSGSGTVINYGSGSDFFTSYGSGSTSQKVTVLTVPVPQHCSFVSVILLDLRNRIIQNSELLEFLMIDYLDVGHELGEPLVLLADLEGQLAGVTHHQH